MISSFYYGLVGATTSRLHMMVIDCHHHHHRSCLRETNTDAVKPTCICKDTSATLRIRLVPPTSQRLNPQFGAKAPQVIVPKARNSSWQQLTGNNIEVEGFDLAGEHRSPAYNLKCGFKDGEFVNNFFFLSFSSSLSFTVYVFFNGWK